MDRIELVVMRGAEGGGTAVTGVIRGTVVTWGDEGRGGGYDGWGRI